MPRPRASLAPRGKADGPRPLVHFPFEPILALDPSALDRLVQASFFLDDEDEDDAPESAPACPVAIVDVRGPLVHHANWWWDNYEDIASSFCEALEDDNVDAVLLRIDSPGGYVSGLAETMRRMREAKLRAGKPVVAYANEQACSAAYGLASVADLICLPPAGTVGSVGVMLTIHDESKANAQMGLRVEVLVSGEQKTDGHPDVPLTPAALDRMRGRVRDLASLFLGDVSQGRRLTPDALAALQAGVFLGPRALEVGLADRLCGFADALAEATSRGAAARATRPASSSLFPAAAVPSPGARAASPTPVPGASAPPLSPTPQRHMKSVLAFLGLPESASEGDALAALSARGDVARQLQAITGTSSPQAALGAVQAFKDNAAEAASLKAQLEGAKRAREDSEKAALCSKLRDEYGYTKAQVDKLAESMSLDGLRGYASVATKQAHAEEQKEAAKGSGSGTVAVSPVLTAADKEACRQTGMSEADFLENKRLDAQEGR